MWFKSIEAKAFRQFRKPLVLSPLEPRLNIVSGANETGKSTLLKAVRAALFERSKSAPVAKNCHPYGDPKAQPEIRITFELLNEEYQFYKCFTQKKYSATLTGRKEQWEGPAAEEQLAQMLGFEYAKRGISKPELQGLASLLWVDQANTWQTVKVSDQARNRLHEVFGTEVGRLLGGGQGEALLDRVRELREQYLTARQGKPRGKYKELQEREAELAEKLEREEQELAEYKKRCDYLDGKEKELNDYDGENSVDQASDELQQAQDQQRQVRKLQEQLRSAQDKQARKQAELDLAKEQWEMRQQLIEKLEDDLGQEEKARDRQQVLREAMKPAEAELQMLSQEHTRLQSEYSATEQKLRIAQDKRELEEKTRELQRLKKTREEINKARQEARECTARRDAIPVTSKIVISLREAEQKRLLAAERLNAASTVLEYKLEKHVSVQLDDTPISGDGQIHLTESTSLKVKGTGTLKIIPGGHDLRQRRLEVESTEREFQSILSKAGSDSLSAAERALEKREKLELETNRYEERVLALAEAGTSDLEEQIERLEAERKTLRQNQKEAHGTSDRKIEEMSSEVEMKDLKHQMQKQQGSLKQAEEELKNGEKHVQEEREKLIKAGADLGFKEKQVEGTRNTLQKERKSRGDSLLQESFRQAEQELDKEERKLDRLTQSLTEADPEAIELEVQRKEEVLEQARKRGEVLEQTVRDLKVELNTLAGREMADQKAEAETAHLEVKNSLQQIEREACAADLLYRLLEESRKRTKEYVTKPVVDQLTTYLKLLLPESAPDIDEKLGLSGIHRNQVLESFENLSIGTREQLAVLVRLAYADLLSAEKQPVTVILDDPLTNSDEERHERMNEILYRAAQNYQILLFTCHPSAYRNSGGHHVSLEDCKAKG